MRREAAKVYQAERDWADEHPDLDEVISLEDARGLTRLLCVTQKLSVPEVRGKESPLDPAGAAYNYLFRDITFHGPEYVRPRLVAHEVAHHAARFGGHGKYFRFCVVRNVLILAGREVAYDLAWAYKAEGLKMKSTRRLLRWTS